MEEQDFINQWLELQSLTSGMTADEIRDYFADNVIRELEKGVGLDHNLIDINYKDIAATFIVKGNNVRLHESFETYDDNGNFLDVIFITEKK